MTPHTIFREEFDAATYALDFPRVKRYAGLDLTPQAADLHFGRAWSDGWMLGAFARREWEDGNVTAGVRVERRW